MLVTLIVGVHHHGGVAQHGFWTGGGHRQMGQAFDRVGFNQRVFQFPQVTFGFDAFHFQVRYCCFQNRVPIHQALAAVNQALLKQAYEYLCDRLGQGCVHGEIFPLPIYAGTHASHLLGNFAATFVFPFPDLFHEFFAAQIMAGNIFRGQLTFHHNLGGNACMVGARLPQGVVAAHAVIARQPVHDGLVERMAHVQSAGDVGWWQLNAKVGLAFHCSGRGMALALPFRAPVGFNGVRVETFGKGHGSGT